MFRHAIYDMDTFTIYLNFKLYPFVISDQKFIAIILAIVISLFLQHTIGVHVHPIFIDIYNRGDFTFVGTFKIDELNVFHYFVKLKTNDNRYNYYPISHINDDFNALF